MLVQEVAEWYDKWHVKNGTESWRLPFEYEPLLYLLTVKAGEKLLDLGCGTGFFLMAAASAGLETYGIDISKEAVVLSREASPKSIVNVCSMEDLGEIKDFDYVTALGSLEHCLDTQKAIFEAYRVLKPGGLFMVMVPNSKYGGPAMSTQSQIIETTNDLSGWKLLFEKAGFKVEQVSQDMTMFRPDVPLERTYQFIFKLRKT